VLTDFGIAQITDGEHLTATGAAMGTFVFMAPEQRSDAKSVDHRADVYGLGATIFTLLTLRTSAELFFAEARDELLEGIPDPLQPVILCACRYEREQRYPTMKAMRDALSLRLAQLPPDPDKTPLLTEKVMPLPEQVPTVVAPNAGLDDLISILSSGPGEAPALDPFSTHHTGPARSESRTDSSEARMRTGGFQLGGPSAIEDAPTVMPYRMPDRSQMLKQQPRGPSANSEVNAVPDYIDTASLPPSRPASVAPPDESPGGRGQAEAQLATGSAYVSGVQSLPPTQLAPPAPAEEDPVVSNASRVLIAVAVIVLMLSFGTVGSGIASKWMASSARQAAGEALVAQIDLAPTLPDELARAGADGDRLRKLFFGYQDAKGAGRLTAAAAYAEAVVAEAKRIDAQGIAGTNARQLDASLQDFQASDERWRAAKATRIARLTGDVGSW
jgi:hypothetical protein